jgi:hypothetical protein
MGEPRTLKRLIHIDNEVWSYLIGNRGIYIRFPDLHQHHYVYWNTFWDFFEIPEKDRWRLYCGDPACEVCCSIHYAPSRIQDYIIGCLKGGHKINE